VADTIVAVWVDVRAERLIVGCKRSCAVVFLRFHFCCLRVRSEGRRRHLLGVFFIGHAFPNKYHAH